MKYKIIPSIIENTEEDYKKSLETIEEFAINAQVDIFDGIFTPIPSVQANVVQKYPAKILLEIQLLTQYPDNVVSQYILPWVETIIMPIETVNDPVTLVSQLHSQKKKVGFSLNPNTPIGALNVVSGYDQITVMTVHPGRMGAEFQNYVIAKIEALRQLYPEITIEVDGGVNDKTLPSLCKAGANYFVCGSFITNSQNPEDRYEELQKLLSVA